MAAIPITNGIRWLIMLAAATYSNWDTLSGLFGRAVLEDPAPPILGYYMTALWEYRDTPTGAWGLDRGQCGVHFVNTTGGDPDYSWTTADYEAAESLFTALWTAHKGHMPNSVRLSEFRWYAFGPDVTAPNPAVRVNILGTPVAGTSSATGPRQLASALTFKTPLRKHWGRIYLPADGGMCDTAGRIPSAVLDALEPSLVTFATGDTTQGVFPCVYDRNTHAVLGISGVQMDDVPDIIRRRRPSTTNYRKASLIT